MVSRSLGREQAVARLLVLDGRGELAAEHVRLVAAVVGVSPRTVRRWLDAARQGRTGRVERDRFRITDELHGRLAAWCGNAAAVHRELVAEAAAACAEGKDVPGVPSLATLHRAIRLDLNAGQRAALAGGERARRRHDVHLRRPRLWRNACWEADHKHLPVEVVLDGVLVCPWVTWFVDCATNAITGAAVTAHQPSRDAILAALRIALSREGVYGPVGGLPSLVRIDRGADFLSDTVGAALGAFAVPVQRLPPYRPDLKGTVENLNRCVVRMFCAALPRYRHAPTATVRLCRAEGDRGQALPFTVFVELLLDWVREWNTGHGCQALGGRTPLEVWQDDPTPVEDVDEALLWAFTLEDDGRQRTLTESGVRWRNRYYVGEWMNGLGCMKVRVRFVPHHDHEIEVFDAVTGGHLGRAFLADAASREQRAGLRRAKEAERRRLVKALAAADSMRYRRYEAVTEPVAPKQLGALTETEAQAQLARAGEVDLAARALPDLIPPGPPPGAWARPVNRSSSVLGPPAVTGPADGAEAGVVPAPPDAPPEET